MHVDAVDTSGTAGLNVVKRAHFLRVAVSPRTGPAPRLVATCSDRWNVRRGISSALLHQVRCSENCYFPD